MAHCNGKPSQKKVQWEQSIDTQEDVDQALEKEQTARLVKLAANSLKWAILEAEDATDHILPNMVVTYNINPSKSYDYRDILKKIIRSLEDEEWLNLKTNVRADILIKLGIFKNYQKLIEYVNGRKKKMDEDKIWLGLLDRASK